MCKPNLKQCGAEGTIALVCSLRPHTGENAVFSSFLIGQHKDECTAGVSAVHFRGISSGMFEHITRKPVCLKKKKTKKHNNRFH